MNDKQGPPTVRFRWILFLILLGAIIHESLIKRSAAVKRSLRKSIILSVETFLIYDFSSYIPVGGCYGNQSGF